MRIATAALVLCLGPLASAQVADTTSAWRYLPLYTGNVWEYENWIEECIKLSVCWDELVGYERWSAEGDTVVSDTGYTALRIDHFDAEGEWSATSQRLVRFDTTQARGFRRYTDGFEEPWPSFLPCPLNAPLDGQINCDDDWKHVYVEAHDEVTVEVAGESEARMVKYYWSLGWSAYVADVGMLSGGFVEFGGSWMDLTYAMNGEVRYGAERFPIASEEAATAAPAGALVLFPNPPNGDATLRVSLDRPQRAMLAVYDVLGRRVLAADLGVLPSGERRERLDVSALPPGLYIVRLSGERGGGATARLLRQ